MNCRVAGLCLAGCVSVSYLLSTACVLADGPDPSLAAAARAAKAQFHPLTKDDLNQAKAELTAAVDRLDGRLKKDATNGEGWRKYTQLDKLQAELRAPAGPDLAVFSALRENLSSGQEGLELVWFVDVRQALRKYIERAGAIDNPQVKTAYEQVLDRLAADLEASALQPSTNQAFRIGEALRWLDSTRQAPQLVESVSNRLVHPNLYIQVNGAMVGAGIAGPVDEVAPIRDCILGTNINGTGRTVGQTTVNLFPDADEAVFDIILLAVNNSQSVGRNGPVCVYTNGRTGIGVCKRVWMDADGLSAHPAAANADTSTTISDICAVNGSPLIERMAWRRTDKQKGEAESIASQHARCTAAGRVDQQAAEMLQKANDNYRRKFRVPLSERLVFPQILRFSTTTNVLNVVGLEAAADQLAAPVNRRP